MIIRPTPTDSRPSFGGASVGRQSYTIGTAITTLQLPAATGGDGTLTYTLAPAVPGLTFTASTRRLSGTLAPAGTYNITYRVTDADVSNPDSASLTFVINVAAASGFAPADQAAFDRLAARRQVGADPNERLIFLSAGRIREVDDGVAEDGDYVYRNTGTNTGTLTYTYDDTGNEPSRTQTKISLTFASALAGTFTSVYTEAGGTPQTGSGNFELVQTPAEPQDDHGDTRSAATVLALDASGVAGSIERGNDVDYFKINVTSSITLTVYATDSLDTEGILEDNSGLELANNDDSGASINFRISRWVTGGTYYIKVGSFSSDTGDYRLYVETSTLPDLTVAIPSSLKG